MRPTPRSLTFARDDLRCIGWSDPAITRAVRAGRLTRLRRGILCAGPADPAALAIATAQACAGSAVSHCSALGLRDLPVVGQRASLPELTVPPRRIGSLVGAHLHRASLPAHHLDLVGGTVVTSVARTLVDVARTYPTALAVAAADAALHRGLVTDDELTEVLLFCWNWPGIRRAQRSLALVDGRSESPLESVSRLVLRWLRLPGPLLQPDVRDASGRFLGRLDFYWDETGVAGEADGAAKYTEPGVIVAEKARQERIEETGIVVARWGWDMAVHRPQLLRTRLLTAFERGALRDRSGFRRGWSVHPR